VGGGLYSLVEAEEAKRGLGKVTWILGCRGRRRDSRINHLVCVGLIKTASATGKLFHSSKFQLGKKGERGNDGSTRHPVD